MFPRAALAAVVIPAGLALAAGAAGGHDSHQSNQVQSPGVGFGVAYDYEPPAPGSYSLPPIGRAADGRLIDSQGVAVALSDLLAERITVLSFIYTRCSDPNGCPLATTVLNEIQNASQSDPFLAARLQLLSLSFDPAHDTPEVMAEFAESTAREGGAPWRFLTAGGEAQLAPVLDGYGQAVGEKSDPNDEFGPLTHQLRVYLIDRERRVRNIYSLGFLDARLLLADIRTLLLEAPGSGSEGSDGTGG